MTEFMNYENLPHFLPDRDKLIASILFILEEKPRTRRRLSRGDIVKTLFIADDSHLREQGRPVTFDNYVAMEKGPVGDLAINLLKGTVTWSTIGLKSAPWSISKYGGLDVYDCSDVKADRDELSPSDKNALISALQQVLSNGFKRTSEQSHNHPAWTAAWFTKGPDANAAPMDWRLFGSLDDDHLADLAAHSRELA